jgi:hypothetical protein
LQDIVREQALPILDLLRGTEKELEEHRRSQGAAEAREHNATQEAAGLQPVVSEREATVRSRVRLRNCKSASTNDRENVSSPRGSMVRLTRYAQRMLIENGISEAVQFFHIDALSSMIGMKVDFDMQVTLLASSLYRIMAHRIGREYSHSQTKTLFRNLLDLSGKVEISATSVVVTLDQRAHNPYLVASGRADQTTPMPWFGNKKLAIQFA